MKLIFISPFYPLWSKDIKALGASCEAKVTSFGDLMRAEIASKSFMGRKMKEALSGGELLRLDLASLLISHKLFQSPESAILVNYPNNVRQAEALAKRIKKSRYGLSAVLALVESKASVIAKFESQFRCVNPLHPAIESQVPNPECDLCGEPLIPSYDLNSSKLMELIDSYFSENGALAAAEALSKLLGVDVIAYTTKAEAAQQLEKRFINV